ncbi:MAG: FG-GAP repeat protein, partial [Phycisphaerales bacterium]
ADDGAMGDIFGVSVAISGATAIIGSANHDDNGYWSGSVYLFDTTTGQQLSKLLADDGAVWDRFGESVAISGTTAIVGAPQNFNDGNGSAYLFDISDPTNPLQIAKLLANDGAEDDRFGVSVAISGPTAIVGAWRDDDNGINSGSAYLFDVSTGRQLFKLLADDGEVGDRFGESVAISGTTAIIGARTHALIGAAYLFDANTGAQIAKLLPDDGVGGDQFGVSVAISDPPGKETAIVGAWLDDDNGQASGSAYVFDISDPATPVQIAKLLAEDGAAGDRFGRSVAISPDGIGTAIVGAFEDDDNGANSGSAYLFDVTTGRQLFKLLADDAAAVDEFGISVAINGATAITGASLDDDNGKSSGSAYLFDAAGTPGKCPWDLDGNGSVGASDLLSLLVSWGPCKGCPADFDGNGNVGESDLLALLANWGPCP